MIERENSPPEFLFAHHTLLTLEIQRHAQDLVNKVCERVLGIICDRGGDIHVLVRLLDNFFISEGGLEGIPILFSVGEARS